MNMKKILFSLISISVISTTQTLAQWDLNGTVPNIMGSGGTGSIAGNMQPGAQFGQQPYMSQAAMGQGFMPNKLPTIYNQPGYMGNIWGQNQNIAAQMVGQQLGMARMARLSYMQNGGAQQGLPAMHGVLNGLPPTTLDSFVRNAGGHAEAIYGDEGTNSWPPLNGLSRANTINAGIVGLRSKTLTTGHKGEMLPDASGLGSSPAP